MTKLSLAERLEKYSTPEPKSGCILWTGDTRGGYGCISVEGRNRVASRVAYALAFGPIPPGKIVCHKCDVRACINPDHLFLGTTRDNMKDRDSKGRTSQGERHPRARLTVALVIGLRSRKISVAEAMERSGASESAVREAWHGDSWKSVPIPADNELYVTRRSGRQKRTIA